jgi:hypothetical protein
MANNLSAIMPKIVSVGLTTLSEQAIMPRIVNSDFAEAAARFGDTIDVPVPSTVTADDVAPAVTPPTPPSTTIDKVSIQLSNWKKASFFLTDKELGEIDGGNNFVPMQMGEALRALANAVNASVHAEYKGIYGLVGTPGTTPFASVAGATDARKLLNKQLAPRGARRAVLDFDAEANALGLPAFSDAEKIGTGEVKIEGEIGRKFGIDWFSDDGVVTHTAGTAASATVTTAAAASAGATSISLKVSSGTATLVVGDVLSIAGNSQTYAVTAAATLDATGVSVAVSPALKAAASSGAAVSVRASHVVNLAFHRDAFALAMRPLSSGTNDLRLGNQMFAATEPRTGISLRLEVSRQYKQTVWEFDVLWGVKLVRPQLAVRIAG